MTPALVFGVTADFIENRGQTIPANFKLNEQEWIKIACLNFCNVNSISFNSIACRTLLIAHTL